MGKKVSFVHAYETIADNVRTPHDNPVRFSFNFSRNYRHWFEIERLQISYIFLSPYHDGCLSPLELTNGMVSFPKAAGYIYYLSYHGFSIFTRISPPTFKTLIPFPSICPILTKSSLYGHSLQKIATLPHGA